MELSSLEPVRSVKGQSKNDFDFTINGLLINPFRGKTHDQMVRATKDFMETSQIDDGWLEHIRKGAFLAQDSHAFDKEREDGLSLKRDEAEALRMENPLTGNKWDQPFILYALVVCCSLGAAVQGWDEVSQFLRMPYLTGPLLTNDRPR